jgi:hypothetical protein
LWIPKDVKHQDSDAIEVHGSFALETGRHIPFVDITVHGCHWGESLELPEDLQLADVTRMEDVVDCAENSQKLQIEVAVSIGNNPDSLLIHCGFTSQSRLHPCTQ